MKQVSKEHYEFQRYITKARFMSFWKQIDEVLKFSPQTVLEIGPGPGIVTHILKQQGIQVTTADYADDVGADVIASVLDLPFKDQSFDVVVCCQVLEHLEFEHFDQALSEIHRVCKTGAVISLPHSGRCWPFSLYLPRVGSIEFAFNLQFKPRVHKFNGEHYWEVGKRGYSLSKVLGKLKEQFKEVRNYRFVNNTFHHFFICNK